MFLSLQCSVHWALLLLRLDFPCLSFVPRGSWKDGDEPNLPFSSFAASPPQQNNPQDYLSVDPADLMLTSFLDLLQLGALTPITKQCQRWGAAYVHRGPRASKFSRGPCLVQASPAIAVCGDFLSAPPGGIASVHSAAVSGLAAADAVAKLV